MMREMSYFGLTNFMFNDRNVKNLISLQSSRDKKLFNIDLSNIQWNKHFLECIRGIKKHILKESDDLSAGQRRHQK